MITTRHREEVLNVALAACISARGVPADPETIINMRKPDVIASFRGLRCVIEGKLADVPNTKAIVLEDARKRLEQGLAHLTIAAVYPRNLRSTPIDQLPCEIGRARLEFCVLTEETEIGSWRSGGIDEMLGELRRAHQDLVRDDVLQRAVETLNLGLVEVSNALYGNAAVCERLIQVLGIGDKPDAPAV